MACRKWLSERSMGVRGEDPSEFRFARPGTGLASLSAPAEAGSGPYLRTGEPRARKAFPSASHEGLDLLLRKWGGFTHMRGGPPRFIRDIVDTVLS